MKENLIYIGRVLIHKDGVLVLDIKNLVVDVGKALGISRLFSNTEFAPMSNIGIGTVSTATQPDDVGLGNEIARGAFDAGYPQRVNNVATARTTFPAGVGTGTIREASLMNAASGGVMFARVGFGDIPKTATEPLSITWIITAP
jgi:hypothetical protein